MKAAVIEWTKWMKARGEDVQDINENVEIEVAEILRVDYDPSESGKPEPLFWSEIVPITRDDIDKTIRLMQYSRNDLMDTVKDITEDNLDWEPSARLRPIGNCLVHIAHAELWYITRLNIELPEKPPENLDELLRYSRSTVVRHLLNLPARKMKGVFQPRKYRSPVCNLWTARKVLRRIVDHERLHTKDIKRVLELRSGK